MQQPQITRVALYVRDISRSASFYEKHFNFRCHIVAEDKAILFPSNKGCALVLFQASRGHRIGQSNVKLVFDVPDVRAFRNVHLASGLKFGVVHRGVDYEFSNARDPDKNLIQISNAYLHENPMAKIS